MEALKQAVCKERKTIEHMIQKYKEGEEWPFDNVDIMVKAAQLDVVELSLKLHVTFDVCEKKYLSTRIERDRKGNYFAAFKFRCCSNTILKISKCNAGCKRFKEFAIQISSTGNY